MKKTKLNLLVVCLRTSDGEIKEYGDLTNVCSELPRTKVVNGVRTKIKYTKSQYEEWQHSYTKSIVNELNKKLQRRFKNNPTQYFTKLVPMIITGYDID